MVEKVGSKTTRRLAAAKRWARKQWIINPRYQYRSVLPAVMAAAVYAVLVGAFVFYPMQRNLQSEPDPGIQALLSEQLLQLNYRMWPLLLLAALAGSVYALQYSHRVAGPLYRLNMVLKDLAEGKDIKKVHFRDGDEFREFETLVTTLGEKMQSIRTHDRDIVDLVIDVVKRQTQLKERVEKEEQVPKDDLVWEIDFVLDQLRDIADSAKTKKWGYVQEKK